MQHHLKSQMVVYLELIEVWGRENGVEVFLWIVCNIKILVTASCVMIKCGTNVFESVVWYARESMESQHDRKYL